MTDPHVYTAAGERLYTLQQLAAALGVRPGTVRAWSSRGRLGEPELYLDERTPLWTLPKETIMTTVTAEYGSWNTLSGTGLGEPAESVAAALGEFAGDYDIDALTAEYVAAINSALPDGVSLNGREFYGPYPRREVGIRAVVEAIDFWEIAARHEK